jgi:hypothetical protein
MLCQDCAEYPEVILCKCEITGASGQQDVLHTKKVFHSCSFRPVNDRTSWWVTVGDSFGSILIDSLSFVIQRRVEYGRVGKELMFAGDVTTLRILGEEEMGP